MENTIQIKHTQIDSGLNEPLMVNILVITAFVEK